MSHIPIASMTVIGAFASRFSRRIVVYVTRSLDGAILAPGERAVTVRSTCSKCFGTRFRSYA